MKQPQLLFSYLICLDWTKTTYRKAFCVYEQQTTTPDKESILCKGYPVESSYNTLSSVEYNASGLVSRQNYGNGDYIGYTYDNLDRLTEKVYNGNSINKAKYLYSSDGSIAQTIDYSANTRTKFVYDLAGRIVSEREYNGVSLSEVSLKAYTDYTYADKTNYLTGVRHFSPLGTQTIGYRYGSIASGEMPDQIYSVTWNGKNAVSYTYDILGRLTDKVIGGGVIPSPLHNIYTYVNVDETRTTSLVSSVQTAAGTYSYTYDALGNITSVSDGTYTNSYVYDSLNQLVRENNQTGNTRGRFFCVNTRGRFFCVYPFPRRNSAECYLSQRSYKDKRVECSRTGAPLLPYHSHRQGVEHKPPVLYPHNRRNDLYHECNG